MNRIFVTGAGGLLGKRLVSFLGEKAVGVAREGTGPALDLMRPAGFPYGEFARGDVVVHLAGISSPESCERDPAGTRLVNVANSARFIEKALALGVKTIFFSSDMVYGDNAGPVDESTPPAPRGEYARQKLELEEIFMGEAGFKAFRLSYVVHANDRFMARLRALHEGGVKLAAFGSLRRNAVHLGDVCEAAEKLAGRWEALPSHRVNLAGPRCLSRLELARMYAASFLDGAEVENEEPGPGFYDLRPRTIELKSLYLERLLGRPPLDMERALGLEFKNHQGS